MSDSKEFFFVFGLVVAVVLSIAIPITVYNIHRNNTLLKGVQAGADPIVMACGLDGYDNAACGINAALAK